MLIALLFAGGWVLRSHLPGEVHAASAVAYGATIVRYDIRSRYAHRTLAQTGAIPKDAVIRRPSAGRHFSQRRRGVLLA